MSYRILLNRTRKEAFLLSNDSDDNDEEEYQMVNLTKSIRNYAKTFSSLNWTFEDDIVLWQTDNISYYTLDEYKEINFITYNKEAHLVSKN
jgi:hypothetical protein